MLFLIRCYETAEIDSLPKIVRELIDVLTSDCMGLCLSNMTALRLHPSMPKSKETEEDDDDDDEDEDDEDEDDDDEEEDEDNDIDDDEVDKEDDSNEVEPKGSKKKHYIKESYFIFLKLLNFAKIRTVKSAKTRMNPTMVQNLAQAKAMVVKS